MWDLLSRMGGDGLRWVETGHLKMLTSVVFRDNLVCEMSGYPTNYAILPEASTLSIIALTALSIFPPAE